MKDQFNKAKIKAELKERNKRANVKFRHEMALLLNIKHWAK